MCKLIKIIIGIIIITLAVFAFIKFYGNKDQDTQNTQETGVVVVNDVVAGEVKKLDEENNTFIHKGYGFSLNFPINMTASNFKEGDGEQIIFQGDNGSPAGEWFQMYVSPWDEDEDITVARIKQDLPEIMITDPKRVVLGPKQAEGIGPNALIFYSQDSGLGDTREIWFIYPEPGRGVYSYLYQVTTYKRLDAMIGKILSTLSFENR